MGKFTSGIWFILVTLYFIFFIGTVSVVNLFAYEEGINFNDGTITNGSLTGLNVNPEFFCDTPRYTYSADGSNQFKINPSSSNCRDTAGVVSEDICERIVGCSWEEVTSGFWFFSSTSETCVGTINATHYGKTNQNNFCTANNVSGNLTNCILMFCTWYETQPLQSDITSPRQLINLIGELFTFRYNFGFDGFLNIFITILFIFIPLLIWLLSLYFLLPFIH